MGPSFIPLSLRKATAVLVACFGVACATGARAQVCALPAGATDAGTAQSDCLLSAARAAYRERRYADALSILERLDSVAGTTSPLDVRISAGLVRAQSLFQLGRIDEMHAVATSTWRDARESKGEDSSSALEAQNLVAVALRNKRRTKDAIAVLEDLVARRERVDGAAAVETIRAKNNLAAALRDAGDLAHAEPLFQDVYSARAKSLGPNHEQSVFAWHNLMAVRWERYGSEAVLREVESALPAQQEALGRENSEIVRMKTLLASMLWAQGRLDETRELFAEALPIRRRVMGVANRQTQEAARNLAFITLRLGDIEGALDIIETARRDAAGSSDASARELRQQLAYVRLLAGDAHRALELVTSEVPAADAHWNESSPSELAAAFIRAAALSALGRHDEAISLQGRVLEAVEGRLGRLHPNTLQSLRGLATFLIAGGKDAAARDVLETFLERSEARDGALAGGSDTHRRQLSQGIESLFQLAGYKTYVRLLAATDPTRALEVAELAKGRSLAEPGAVSGRGQVARSEAREAAWRLAKAEEALAASEPGSAPYLRAANERAEAEARLRTLRPAAGTTRRFRLADRIATLPKGAVFIDYVVDDDRVVALLAGKDLPVTGIDLGRVDRLADTVEALRRLTATTDPASERVWRTADGYRWSLSKPPGATDRTKDATEIARFLSRNLLAPLAPHVGKSPRWIVSPDGALAFLPFELLEISGKRVVENHEITIAPSLAVITAGKARAARVLAPGANREFLGIGVSRAGGDWPELPAAEREVSAVANLFPADRRVTLTGAQATEAAFAKLDASGDLERFRYIHIASHAFLSPRGSSLSGVVLAKDAADEANDGIVTAAEWPVYRLRSDLVVLSACDTGRGTLLAGEGVMGLPYALLQAGARDVLLTLWPVSDAAAADFMPRFYGRLRKGMPPAKALRETKLELARARGPHAAPAHWAAFVLHGVP